MDYMFLLYTDEKQMANLSPEERTATITRHWAIVDDAQHRGVYKAASPLEPTSTAFVARARDGQVTFTDGPYAETREALAGFYMIDCRDDAEARYWASRLSETLCGIAVEFRKIRAVPQRANAGEPSAVLANA